MATARSGSTLNALYCASNYPTDHIDYTGTVQGDEFVARMTPIPNVPLCGSSATLEGKSSACSQRVGGILMQPKWTLYHLPDGDMQVTFSWSADLE